MLYIKIVLKGSGAELKLSDVPHGFNVLSLLKHKRQKQEVFMMH